ncbi:MAG: GAF domain-containing protein [Labilithrix sp.]|nr:GAF domain-containing protein [Labilithrix sp.]MCW5810375.1 GAF domain-containing protein [Labilithrix sp.]
MSKPLSITDLPARCFQGVAPTVIATCGADGIPNVTYTSQMYLLDDGRVALSCQFFNKTKQNVLATKLACLQVYDPVTFEAYRVVLRYHHDETEGPFFESMSRRIDAIATHTGMAGVFKLRSADVFDVVSVEKTENFMHTIEDTSSPLEPTQLKWKGELYALQYVSKAMRLPRDVGSLYTATLEALEHAVGFEHSMILLPDESGKRLYAIAARGYGESGIGAEVGFGEGLIGTVARERCSLRVSGVGAELRYGRAIRTSVQRSTGGRDLRPEIPLPGLVDAQSQLAIPLVADDELVGVLALESPRPAAFEPWHEAFLEIIANQIATAIDAFARREKDDDEDDDEPVAAAQSPSQAPVECTRTLKLRFFKSDDCVFNDDEYLVRNLPGRILWKLLGEHVASGRTEFTNRELRLDGSLGLPALRDNLESRLVLLRKRLEQKCPEIRLVPVARGRFRLELECPLDLAESP